MLDELEIKQKLCKIIELQLGKPTGSVGVSSTIEELGIDSLDTIELIMEFEEAFDIEIDEYDLTTMENVGDLRDYICNKIFLYKQAGSEAVVDKIQQVTSKLTEEDTYTIKLDFDSMQEQVVKFLVTLYKDNREFDDGCIKDSILEVIEYCTTRDQYAIVKAELGIN